MKRVILLIAAAITFGFSVSAQDVILLKSAEEIKCKVVEIGGGELKYRKSEMPDGPLYSLPLGEIFSVTYANGHRETFKNFSQTSNIQQPKFANASTKGEYPYPPVSRAYRIGEIFDEGGVKGVVIHTTDDGRHGLIISLVESDDTAWGYVKHGERVEVFETKARSLIDGWQNMKIIEEIVKNTPLTWSNFPAFQWCRELGAGWYLPAIDEIEEIMVGGYTDFEVFQNKMYWSCQTAFYRNYLHYDTISGSTDYGGPYFKENTQYARATNALYVGVDDNGQDKYTYAESAITNDGYHQFLSVSSLGSILGFTGSPININNPYQFQFRVGGSIWNPQYENRTLNPAQYDTGYDSRGSQINRVRCVRNSGYASDAQ